MNKFTLSFPVRQLEIRINSWLRLFTTAGEIIVQYCPCTEAFSLGSNGCHSWTYTFCVQDTDLPSAIQDVCGITSDILVAPFMLAIPPINFEDTITVDVQGDGSELLPYNMNVIIDPDPDNDLEARANGLFADSAAGADGADGADGASGTNGADGSNGTNGADGSNGSNGSDGAGPPVGMIFPVPATGAPANTEPLWGQLINRGTWPELWDFANASGNIIDDATWLGDPLNVGKFSSGDLANTFRLPNLRGYFLRVWNNDDGANYPDDNRDFASAQDHAIENITGDFQLEDVNILATTGAFQSGAANMTGSPGGNNPDPDVNVEFDASNVVNTDPDETRPKNIAYMYVIQAASIV